MPDVGRRDANSDFHVVERDEPEQIGRIAVRNDRPQRTDSGCSSRYEADSGIASVLS